MVEFCCLRRPFRSQSIAAGAFSLFLSVIDCGLTSYNLDKNRNELKTLWLGNATGVPMNITATTEAKIEELQAIDKWFQLVIGLCVFLFITSVIEIIGAIRSNHFWLLPWVVVIVVITAIDTVVTMQTVAYTAKAPKKLNFVPILIYVIATTINNRRRTQPRTFPTP
ncbi:hypothetical protein CAPTEDRAFT_200437 [Capitella teleta]|uniref:Uncharacterized protein n=1 Tax=Capitella teleta TaxID=283909 RepID=R7UFM1_CAPTE|nr:hypothetical protein CAPTEDRAFT_200437 [Capitella teleta]|eukprot:ELU05005.1 hypothetical protein CAPTEDRAFT_200437 [Capitella teleta]